MALPIVAGEFEAITNDTNALWSTVAGRYDSDACRGAFIVDSGESFYLDLGTSELDVWVHANIVFDNAGGGADDPFCVFRDIGAGQDIVNFSGLNGDFTIAYWNGSGTTEFNTFVSIPTDTLDTYDMRVFIDGSVGAFQLYQNGLLLGEVTGDTDFDSLTTERIQFKPIDTNIDTFFSEIIIDDADTIGQRLITLGVDGNGGETDWNGTVTDVDEVGPVDDGTSIDNDTDGEYETFTAEDVDSAFTAGYDVNAVIIASTAASDATGVSNMSHALRIDSTNYDGANLSGLTSSLVPGFQTIWATNPDTTNDWVVAELDDIEIGVLSET